MSDKEEKTVNMDIYKYVVRNNDTDKTYDEDGVKYGVSQEGIRYIIEESKDE